MESDRVILGPVTTEKADRLQEKHNVVCFRVHPDANKVQIRRAVESLFEVEVTAVRTAGYRGRYVGRKPDWKKAFVTLAEGHSVQIFKGV